VGFFLLALGGRELVYELIGYEPKPAMATQPTPGQQLTATATAGAEARKKLSRRECMVS